MRLFRYLSIILIILSPACFADIHGEVTTSCEGFVFKELEPITAASAIIMDPSNGQIMYGRNIHTRRPNASTTKIMTAILFIENTKPDDMIKASRNAAETPFTSIYLQPGELISAKDLLCAMLIRSANDTCIAAAEHVGGSVPKFAVMMNKKAKALGCKNTHFVTPNGLYDEHHYSSVYDLCLIAKYAMKNKTFNDVIKMKSHMLLSRTINRENLLVRSKSVFLRTYPGADGIKSGYIRQAGNCYVGSATRNGWRILSAVLKSDNANAETAVLMDYVFDNFDRKTVASTGKKYTECKIKYGCNVDLVPAHDFTVVAKKDGARISTSTKLDDVKAPVKKGDKLGTLTATVDGKYAGSVDLCAAKDVNMNIAWTIILSWKWFVGAFLILKGWQYASKITKNSRRRRHCVKASKRSSNYVRRSQRKRKDYYDTWRKS